MSLRLIALSTLIIGSLSIGNKIIGFFREVIFAAYFGVSTGMDAFLMAQIIPCSLGSILSVSLIVAFIPMYSNRLARNDKQANEKYAIGVIFCLLIITVLFSVALFFLAPMAVSLLVPNWPDEVQTQTIHLMRIMAPCFVFLLLLAVFSGIQQANNRFVFPYLGPGVYSLTIIAGVALFGSGGNIYALGYATTLATLLQLALQWLGLKKMGFVFRATPISRDIIPRELIAFLVPAILVTFVNDSAFLIDRFMASLFPSGSISALNYAYRINALSGSMIAASIAAASYPVISQCIGRGDYQEMNRNVNLTLRMCLYVIVPAMVAIWFFSEPIIGLLFQRGAFDANAVHVTSGALFFLSFGMIGVAAVGMLGQSFCALKDVKTLSLVTIVIIGTKSLGNLILMRNLAANGLALATSVSFLFGAGLLLYYWARRFGFINKQEILKTIREVTLAAIVMGIGAKISHIVLLTAVFPAWGLNGIWANRFSFIGAVIVGVVIYSAVLAILKSEGYFWIRDLAARKLR